MRKTAKLHIDPTTAGASSIEVNGQRIRGVRGFAIDHEVPGVPDLTLEFNVHELDIDGEMEIYVSDNAREGLLALGWTPPIDDVPTAKEATS